MGYATFSGVLFIKPGTYNTRYTYAFFHPILQQNVTSLLNYSFSLLLVNDIFPKYN